jgi:uncharacterized protein (DUF779 family)
MSTQIGAQASNDQFEKILSYLEIVGCEFWMDREQLRRWAHTRWTVDVVPGRGASFSLEAPLNMRFLIRSSMCAVS